MRPAIVDLDKVSLPSAAHLNHSLHVDSSQESALVGTYGLNKYEEWWRDQYELLLEHGYKLRRRYRPDWTPSWLGYNLDPYYCEDSLRSISCRRVLDAVRVCDGAWVVIKKVHYTRIGEIKNAKYFMELQESGDSSNHCVPILDLFKSEDKDFFLLVMPFLCDFDEPPFSFVDEVIEFIHQTMQGLDFLHQRGIAHRDLGSENIMMDGEQLYPEGHHPVLPPIDYRTLEYATTLRRRDVILDSPVTYYFIDFEVTDTQNSLESPKIRRGIFGQDPDVPEINRGYPYNPFLVDIFTLGNVYKKRLLQKYSNLSFLEPLVSSMIRENPNERPSIREAFIQFHCLVKNQTWLSRRSRLRCIDETPKEALVRDVKSFVKEEIAFPLYKLKGYVASAAIASAAICAVRHAHIESCTLIIALMQRSVAM